MSDSFGNCPAWRYGMRPISDDRKLTCQTTEDPALYKPQVGCCSTEIEKSEELINDSLLINLCFIICLIIIAALVGFSFTKRPCSHENITSVTTGASANLVTQSSATTENTKSSIEPIKIGII